jgi:ABC-type uncharacterized transport system auxiliary subunit
MAARRAWLPALAVLLAACAGVGDPPAPHQSFLVRLDADGAGAPASRKPLAAVYVAPVLVSAPYSDRNLVVRQSDLGFVPDPYVEFAANPASMWSDVVRDWLQARGLFERVLPAGSGAQADLRLETSVLEAVVDRRAGQPPASRVTIRFVLVSDRAPDQVLLDRTFTHAEPVRGSGAEHEVAALSLAASDALRDLESALALLPE